MIVGVVKEGDVGEFEVGDGPGGSHGDRGSGCW